MLPQRPPGHLLLAGGRAQRSLQCTKKAYLVSRVGRIGEHSAALQSYGLLQQGENPCDLKFTELYDRIDTSTSKGRTRRSGYLVKSHSPAVPKMIVSSEHRG